MTPPFADAVDPIFLRMLEIVDRIALGDPVDAPTERTNLHNMLVSAGDKLRNTTDWQLASYAIVGWIDEVLIKAEWESAVWWTENPLEVALFDTRIAFTEFFSKATEAAQLRHKNALECYYVCVVLGFRGVYEDETSSPLLETLSLPPDIETWADRTASMIRFESLEGRPPVSTLPRPVSMALPRTGRYMVVGTVVLGGVLLAIGGVLLLLPYFTS